MSSPNPLDLAEAEQLLPWHVNHTLGQSDEQSLQAALASSPKLTAEARWLESLGRQLREEIALPPPDQGLDTLLARIHSEQAGKVTALPQPARKRVWPGAVMALAAGVMLAQAVVIGGLLRHQAPVGEIVPASGDKAVAGGALLQVTFRETATEAQLRAALSAVHGTIVSGPGMLGVYTVRVEAASAESAVARLRADTAVNSVTQLARP